MDFTGQGKLRQSLRQPSRRQKKSLVHANRLCTKEGQRGRRYLNQVEVEEHYAHLHPDLDGSDLQRERKGLQIVVFSSQGGRRALSVKPKGKVQNDFGPDKEFGGGGKSSKGGERGIGPQRREEHPPGRGKGGNNCVDGKGLSIKAAETSLHQGKKAGHIPMGDRYSKRKGPSRESQTEEGKKFIFIYQVRGRIMKRGGNELMDW